MFNRELFSNLTSKVSLVQLLTALYASSSFLLVFVAVVFLYWTLEKHIEQDAKLLLQSRFEIIQETLAHHEVTADRLQHALEGKSDESNGIFSRLVDADGNVLAETANMEKVVPRSFYCADSQEYSICTAHSAYNKTFYVLSTPVKNYYSGKIRIVIGFDQTREEVLLHDLKTVCTWLLLLTGITSLIAGFIITKKGMEPLKKITMSLAHINSENLNERVRAESLPKELEALAVHFNAMMDRLEFSFTQLNRFSADIAHELRTPINNLRGSVEVGLGRIRSVNEYQDILVSSLEECERVSNMIDNLLFLARAEQTQTKIYRERINVLREIENIVDYFETETKGTALSLEIGIDETLNFSVDKELFQRAVANIISNSLKHTNAGHIRICAWIIDSELVVELSDTGKGIASHDLPFVFERFYRADQSRASTRFSSGLGLAIVRGIMDLHGGTAEAQSTVGLGTKIVLTFPSK